MPPRYPGKKLILLFDEYELFENKIDAAPCGGRALISAA